jgi:hypothetical protein
VQQPTEQALQVLITKVLLENKEVMDITLDLVMHIVKATP